MVFKLESLMSQEIVNKNSALYSVDYYWRGGERETVWASGSLGSLNATVYLVMDGDREARAEEGPAPAAEEAETGHNL